LALTVNPAQFHIPLIEESLRLIDLGGLGPDSLVKHPQFTILPLYLLRKPVDLDVIVLMKLVQQVEFFHALADVRQ
jgi:hypothetical protein